MQEANESHLRLDKRVAGYDQQNQDWSHLLLPVSQERRVHPADQWTRNPPERHPNVPLSEVRELTWSHHISTMHNKALRKMALVKKLAGTKWEANMKILTQVYTATSRPLMEYASSAWSSAASTNLDQLTNAGLRIITGVMKNLHLRGEEDSRPAVTGGKERGKKLLRQKEKMKRFPSRPLLSKFETPTKIRLKRQSPNHLVKALQQKHRIPSSARNQPLETLQSYEDWQAEAPTIILDIPGIETKEHYTDEELRSLTLEALVLPTHLPPGQELTQIGQQKRQQKNGRGGVFIKLPDGRSIRKSVVTGCSQQTAELKPTPCSQQPRPWTRKRDFLPTKCFWLIAVHPAVFNHQEGTRSPATSDRSCPCLRTKPVDSFLQWCWRQWGSWPAVKKGKQVGAISTAHVLQRSKHHPKEQLQDGVAAKSRHWDRRGQHPPAGQSDRSHNL